MSVCQNIDELVRRADELAPGQLWRNDQDGILFVLICRHELYDNEWIVQCSDLWAGTSFSDHFELLREDELLAGADGTR